MTRPPLLAAAVIVLTLGMPAAAQPQARVEVVGPTGEIPADSYQSWALFLVCNPDWVTNRRAGDLMDLYGAFKRFGDAIGPRNLAVWFWNEQMRISDPRIGDNVNVARAAGYCANLGLTPSEGPFIVITTERPGVDSVPPARGVFQLGNLQPEQIETLLNKLTDALATGRASDTFGGQPQPSPATDTVDSATGLWIRILEGARQTIVGFGCAISIRISTGVFSAELRECPEA